MWSNAVVTLLPLDPLQGGNAAIGSDWTHGAHRGAEACVKLLKRSKNVSVQIKILNRWTRGPTLLLEIC